MAILYFIILLSVIIIVHECGHLIAAKCFHVYCGEFSIGMGPKLWSYKGKETTFTLRALPIGGYVAMAGEEGSEFEGVPRERTIKGVSHWKQIIIMLAGVIMNFVLAWLIFASIILINGSYNIAPKAVVGGVVAGSPAEAAGFAEGDVITKVVFADGTVVKPSNFYEILTYSMDNTDPVTYTLKRGGETLEKTVAPVYDEQEQSWLVGIKIPPATQVKTTMLNSGYYGAQYMGQTVKELITALTRLVKGIGFEDLSGPVGIYQVTEQQASLGLQNYILLIALLSLNVGVFNLLPLPILDGGRILLVIVEMIIGKPLNQKLEAGITAVGVALVLLLMVYVTWQDLMRLFI